MNKSQSKSYICKLICHMGPNMSGSYTIGKLAQVSEILA